MSKVINENESRQATRSIYNTRLLNVAKALREAVDTRLFTMQQFAHSCGTPACAMGYYAARHDLQSEFRVGNGDIMLRQTEPGMWEQSSFFRPLSEHFGISPTESVRLFGAHGCDDAKTAIEAALYIERFVDERERQSA